MKNSNEFFIVLILIIFVAILTNPSTTEHKEAVKLRFNKNVLQSVSHNDSNGFEQLGRLLGTSIAGNFIENSVSRDNYLVFSITVLTWDGKSKNVGYGLFGNVFISKNVNDAFLDE